MFSYRKQGHLTLVKTRKIQPLGVLNRLGIGVWEAILRQCDSHLSEEKDPLGGF